ncbi:MAG TPA: NAD(P)-dependent oxidoreductase [Gammaproteobacteria bacterium]|nr:NAD(P)-dependent oxidoreductase [Gammaproteobacteria bacterium]
MKRIAILGFGAMGSRVASRLLEAGYPVTVFNRTPERARNLISNGAIWANTPRQAAAQSDVTISMVTDDEASREVWLDRNTGALTGLTQNSIAIESSTLTPEWIKQLHKEVSIHGASLLDAPVAGSRPQADAGQLIYFVGGEEDVLNQVKKILAATGSNILHTGPTGSGTRFKLAVNALFGIQTAALGEMLGFLKDQGMEVNRCVEWLNALPTTSPAMKAMGQLMAAQQFAPLFPLHLVEKDFRYFCSTVKNPGYSPMAFAAWDVYQRTIEQQLGEENISALIRLYT